MSRSRVIELPGPLDLRRTLGALDAKADGRGSATKSSAWRATRTPDGPATLHFEVAAGRLEVEAWGSGADWALEHCPSLVGMDDEPDAFRPPPGLIHELHRRARGLRLGRTDAVFEALMPTILGQKVTGTEAHRGMEGLSRVYGEPAPGPRPIRMAPAPEVVAGLGYEDLHRFGIERKRAVTLIEVARRVRRLEEILTMVPEAAMRRLTAIRGVGPWSAAIVVGAAMGDPDVIPVGDYHLPHTVSWHLAGEPRGTDERMLELLEPYRGQRRRALLLLAGAGHAPRYGPRSPVRSIAGM